MNYFSAWLSACLIIERQKEHNFLLFRFDVLFFLSSNISDFRKKSVEDIIYGTNEAILSNLNVLQTSALLYSSVASQYSGSFKSDNITAEVSPFLKIGLMYILRANPTKFMIFLIAGRNFSWGAC